jgi:hypothetical protein
MLFTDPESRATVSYSEIDTWTACRQRWFWAYGLKLEPRHVSRRPSLGSCAHAGVAAYLLCPGDKLARWLAAGAAMLAWRDNEIRTRSLFPEEIAEYDEILAECEQILFKWFKTDPFKGHTVVAVEHKFSVPIPRHRVVLEGYFDLITRDSLGKLWLWEFKFPGQSFRSENDLDLDVQIGVYHYAAVRSGFPVIGIIFQQVLGKVCKQPKRNQNGQMSRQDLRCDWETYEQALIDAGLDPADYQDMREKLSGKIFWQRYFRHRNKTELNIFVQDMTARVWDMRRKRKHIYMAENRINCGVCPYRELCIEQLRGGHVDDVIAAQFQPRVSRRDMAADMDRLEELVDLQPFGL